MLTSRTPRTVLLEVTAHVFLQAPLSSPALPSLSVETGDLSSATTKLLNAKKEKGKITDK